MSEEWSKKMLGPKHIQESADLPPQRRYKTEISATITAWILSTSAAAHI